MKKESKLLWKAFYLSETLVWYEKETEKWLYMSWAILYMVQCNLHMTFIMSVSSNAELGSRGLEPSHFNFVLSSSGNGRKVNVEITTLEFVEFTIWNEKYSNYFNFNPKIKHKISNTRYWANIPLLLLQPQTQLTIKFNELSSNIYVDKLRGNYNTKKCS